MRVEDCALPLTALTPSVSDRCVLRANAAAFVGENPSSTYPQKTVASARPSQSLFVLYYPP